MADRKQCPDCRTPMSEGFIPNATYGAIVQTHWYEGRPEETSFLGLPTGLSIDRNRMRPVQAWRCDACGLIRLYAAGD